MPVVTKHARGRSIVRIIKDRKTSVDAEHEVGSCLDIILNDITAMS